MKTEHPDRVAIRLKDFEMKLAYWIAEHRCGSAVKMGHKGKDGGPAAGKAFTTDLKAAKAELAVCKFLNLYWTAGYGEDADVDAGYLVEVKFVKREGYRLIIRSDNLDWPIYVLVRETDEEDKMVLCGWCYGEEGKVPKFWGAPIGYDRKDPAYFVDNSVLKPMVELLEIIAERFAEEMQDRVERQRRGAAAKHTHGVVA